SRMFQYSVSILNAMNFTCSGVRVDIKFLIFKEHICLLPMSMLGQASVSNNLQIIFIVVRRRPSRRYAQALATGLADALLRHHDARPLLGRRLSIQPAHGTLGRGR